MQEHGPPPQEGLNEYGFLWGSLSVPLCHCQASLMFHKRHKPFTRTLAIKQQHKCVKTVLTAEYEHVVKHAHFLTAPHLSDTQTPSSKQGQYQPWCVLK